jgi:hypothetical protein
VCRGEDDCNDSSPVAGTGSATDQTTSRRYVQERRTHPSDHGRKERIYGLPYSRHRLAGSGRRPCYGVRDRYRKLVAGSILCASLRDTATADRGLLSLTEASPVKGGFL